MAIDTNTEDRIEFTTPGGRSVVLRPMTLDEEAEVIDLFTEGKRATVALYLLRRCWVGGDAWERNVTGGAADTAIRALPVPERTAIRDHLLGRINLTEEEEGK